LQNEIATLKNHIQSLESKLAQEMNAHQNTKREFHEYQIKAKKIVNHLQTSRTHSINESMNQ
jgi:predicted  nucleic acid-binding Zn-ribbon protein